MSTRSRRSGASGGDTLNPAMIHLLDTGRLRKELEQRNLDTTGNKNLLADRLQEAVALERLGHGSHAYSPPPPAVVLDKSPKKGAKRTAKVKEEPEESVTETAVTSPEAKKRRLSHTAQYDEITVVDASSNLGNTDLTGISTGIVENENVPLAKVRQRSSGSKAGGKGKQAKETIASLAEPPSPKKRLRGNVVTEPAVTRSSSPRKAKGLPVKVAEGLVVAVTNDVLETKVVEGVAIVPAVPVAPRKPAVTVVRLTDAEVKRMTKDSEVIVPAVAKHVESVSVKKSVSKEIEKPVSVAESKTTSISIEQSATTEMLKPLSSESSLKASEERKPTLSPEAAAASAAAPDAQEKKKSSGKGETKMQKSSSFGGEVKSDLKLKSLKVKLKLDSEKAVARVEPSPHATNKHLGKSATTSASKGVRKTSGEPVAAVNVQATSPAILSSSNQGKRKLSGSLEGGDTSKEAEKTASSSVAATEKKKEGVPLRKKIPLRMQAPIDVLDSIFDKQTQLLSSKFKSEQEKSAERQRIEMAKRRQSTLPFGVTSSPILPVEKRRHTVEFSVPSVGHSLPQPQPGLEHRLPPPPRPPDLLLPPRPIPPPHRPPVSLEDQERSVILAAPPPPPLLPPLPERTTSIVSLASSTSQTPELSWTPSSSSQMSSGSFFDSERQQPSSGFSHDSFGPGPSCYSPLSRPPSVPPYVSPTDEARSSSASASASTTTTHVLVDNSVDASFVRGPQFQEQQQRSLPSQLPAAMLSAPHIDMTPDRLREMAKALELVFARIGNVEPGTALVGAADEAPAIATTTTDSVLLSSVVATTAAIVENSEETKVESVHVVTVADSGKEESSASVIQDDDTTSKIPEMEVIETLKKLVESVVADEEESSMTLEEVVRCVVERMVRKVCAEESTVDAVLETLEGALASSSAAREDSRENGGEAQATVVSEASNLTGVKDGAVSQACDISVMETDDGIDNDVEGLESSSRKAEIREELLRDPRLLLQKASDVLKNLHAQEESSTEESKQQYVQISPDPDYEVEDEEKPLPEFHGEPVPDSDDEVIIEGVRKKSTAKKNVVVQEEEPVPGDENIEIDFYNADLHVKASETDQFVISPDNSDGFALMWGGARATYGLLVPDDLTHFPPIIFQAKITEFLTMKHVPFEELDPHDVRVGWSTQNTIGILGEAPHSYAYSSMARIAVNSCFSDFGEQFHLTDVVTSVIDLRRGEISYFKNDRWIGVAFTDVCLEPGEVIFPHVCTKNCKVAMNFGQGDVKEWLPVERLKWNRVEDGPSDQPLVFINDVDRKGLLRGLVPPPSKGDCTVLMMVGLPGVGKTTWVRQYLRDHPGEQWTLLNTDTILGAMKVNGIARSRVHQGRWDMVMGLTAKALTRSLHLACRRRRNYIIDQTNVSKDVRRRKLTQFKDFQRKCVVLIPSEEEMQSRQMRQSRTEGAGTIPVEAMLELKAMFSIPNVETEPIEDVYFVEPPLERIGDAIELVHRFNEEARPWSQKKRGRRGDGRGGDYGGRSHDGARSSGSYSTRIGRRMSDAPSSTSAPVVNCDSRGETPQGSSQPSPVINTRANEGYCGFGGTVPPSLVPSVPPPPPPPASMSVPPPNIAMATSWAERKIALT